MPSPLPNLRSGLYLRMVTVRRVALALGAVAEVVSLPTARTPAVVGATFVLLAVLLYNEAGRRVFLRPHGRRLALMANMQVALDTLALAILLHHQGGRSELALALFAPAFFVYGAALSLPLALLHVVLASVELALVGGMTSTVFPWAMPLKFAETLHVLPSALAAVVPLTVANLLAVQVSHYLTSLPWTQEARSRALFVRSARETERVQALLEVAQHASVTRSVDDLLRAVCDSAVAFLRVPQVDMLLWDADRECLELAVRRSAAAEAAPADPECWAAAPSVVAALRAGEVVHLAALPGTPGRRGFAAPLTCRGWFEGALVVGVDEDAPDDLVDLVQGVARQAALALVNVRTIEQRQEDLEISRVLLGVSQALSACLDEEVLWNLLVRGVSQVLDLPWAIGVGFDEGTGTFHLVGAQGLPEGVTLPDRLRPEDSPVLQDLLSRRELVAAADPRLPPLLFGRDVGSWIAIPLHRGQWMTGALIGGRISERRPFAKRELRLAEGLGYHASIALQNARLFADLETADRLKSEFVSTVSHELRTPVNVIIGYTEMLREGAAGDLTSEQRELIARLDARGRELLDLVEATLQVNRLEAGRAQVKTMPIPLAELVQALRETTAGLPRRPAVSFEWRVPDEPARIVRTDRAKLALVVRNLVGNAFKFTREGRVEVRLAFDDTALVIEVEDTGIGMAPEHLPIIFDMFRQVDGSETRRHEGVGLGLYIVQQFVTRLGGRIDVESTVGVGSVFRVVLPGAALEGERRAA